MKKNIYYLLGFIFLFFSGNHLAAQVAPDDVKKRIRCNTRTSHRVSLPKEACFDTSFYKNLENATAAFKTSLLGYVDCDPCGVDPARWRCSPSIDNVTLGNLRLNAEGTQWCSSKIVQFSFICSMCKPRFNPLEDFPPIKKTIVACGDSTRFQLDLTEGACYDTAIYVTPDNAQAEYEKWLLNTYTGCESCSIAGACTPYKKELLPKKLKLNEKGDAWCATGNISMRWGCSDCKKPFTTSSDHHHHRTIQVEEELGDQQWRVSPNPTAGRVVLDLHTSRGAQSVRLIARNVAGQIVFEKDYGAAAKGDFKARADLSDLANGWYMLSLYLDKELWGTEKIVISQ